MIDNTKESRFTQGQLVVIYTLISLLTLLAVWELVARFTSASMFLPPASQVLAAFFKSFSIFPQDLPPLILIMVAATGFNI